MNKHSPVDYLSKYLMPFMNAEQKVILKSYCEKAKALEMQNLKDAYESKDDIPFDTYYKENYSK